MSYFAKRILKHSKAAKPAVLKHADSTITKTPEKALKKLASLHLYIFLHTNQLPPKNMIKPRYQVRK